MTTLNVEIVTRTPAVNATLGLCGTSDYERLRNLPKMAVGDNDPETIIGVMRVPPDLTGEIERLSEEIENLRIDGGVLTW